MTLSDFDAALQAARDVRAQGADELWSLYMVLSDDWDGADLLSKIDAYVCDASPAARSLYLSIAR